MDLMKRLGLKKEDSKYSRVRRHFESGAWSMDNVKEAVDRGWITVDQFSEITGARYVPSGSIDDDETE